LILFAVLAALEPCSVDVFSLPRGNVVIDGRIYSETPVLGVLLEPGDHRLVVADENWSNPRVIPFTCEAGKRHVWKVSLR
jgi:hypothetical protein